jgi:hypothetical protein
MIKASEAKQLAVDVLRQAQDLSSDATNKIIADLESKIKEAVRFGNMEATVSLEPMNRLNDINIEAAKRTVAYLGHILNDAGYAFDGFTNWSHYTIIRWNES